MATRVKSRPATNGKRVKPEPAGQRPSPAPVLARLRKELGLTARDFSRITGFSERAVANWEAGGAIGAPARRRLSEVHRLFRALADLVRADTLPTWFQTPNPSLGGLKPIEVVERGETDRLWRMVFFLESGVPT
jgi:transcriptional regulator with XRE-family HTH domain